MKRSAVVLLSILAAGTSVSHGARLPDWARLIAESPPPIGEVGEHDSRVLLRETRLAVEPDGRMRVRRCSASQALTPMGREISLGAFAFDESSEIVSSKAWHMEPGGATRRSRGGVLDVSTTDVFLSDQMTRFLTVDGIKTGSLVFYQFETLERREQLAHYEYFASETPVELARVVVQVPSGWTLRHAWPRREGPEPQRDRDSWVFEMRGLLTDDRGVELAEDPLDEAPLLVLSLQPAEGAADGTTSFRDWSEVADWYARQAEGRDAVSPRVRQASLASGSSEDGFLPRVRSRARYVRDRVRYLANDLGQGGYRPRTADSVAQNLYGDCKDKTTLLQAMLAVDGLVAYRMLVNSTVADTVPPELPTLFAFNHVVLAVAVPEDVELPPAYQPAVVESSGLGPLLVIDATDEYASIGSLPAVLSGKTALLVADEASGLLELPADDPRAHGLERRFDAELQVRGALSATLTEKRWGDPAARHRARYNASAQDYESSLRLAVSDIWTGTSIEDLEIVNEDPDGAFVWTARLEIAAPQDASGVALLPLFPGAAEELPRVSLRRREMPVVYDHAMTLRYRSAVRGLPPDSQTVPRSAERRGAGWHVRSEHRVEDDTLESSWELRLARRRFPPGDFDELEALWKAVRRSSSVPFSLTSRLTSAP